jgi:hypothetical protein
MGYNDVIAALGPDYWWKLDDDGTDSADSNDSTGGIAPNFVNSIVPAVSSTQHCGNFNGSSHWYDVSDTDLINNVVTYKKTISAWVKTDTLTTGHGRPIWCEGALVTGLALYQYGNKFYCVAYEDSGADLDYVSTSTTISTGTLYLVTVTIDLVVGEMKMYLNGALEDTNSSLNIGSSMDAHFGENPMIGKGSAYMMNHNYETIAGNYFNGRIADVLYWGEQTPLTLTQIKSIYNAGLGGGGITGPFWTAI